MSVESANQDSTSQARGGGPEAHLGDLVRKLVEGLPPMLGAARHDLELHFKAVLREQLARLDLCSRSDFDAQARLLARTQERLNQVEARLVVLEQQSS